MKKLDNGVMGIVHDWLSKRTWTRDRGGTGSVPFLAQSWRKRNMDRPSRFSPWMSITLSFVSMGSGVYDNQMGATM